MDDRTTACLADMIEVTMSHLTPHKILDMPTPDYVRTVCGLMLAHPELRHSAVIAQVAARDEIFMPIIKMCIIDVADVAPLVAAIKHSNEAGVRYLVGLGMDIRYGCAMHDAFARSKRMFECVLEMGGDILETDDDGNTLLHKKMMMSVGSDTEIDTVRMLMQHGADAHRPNHAGDTPVDLAHKMTYHIRGVVSSTAQRQKMLDALRVEKNE